MAAMTATVLMAVGYVPFLPHLTLLWDLLYPRVYQDWLDYDNHWLAVCDVVFRIPGESSGADKECELAKSLGIPVVTTYDELKARFPLAS